MVIQHILGQESTIIPEQDTIIFMRMCVMIVTVMQARFGQAHCALALLVQRRGAILQS